MVAIDPCGAPICSCGETALRIQNRGLPVSTLATTIASRTRPRTSGAARISRGRRSPND